MKIILSLTFLFYSTIAFSQKVFVTDNRSEADYIIYVTTDKFEANWIVMKTEWRNQAKDGVWFIEKEWKNQADFKIYITTDKSEAKKIVYYTEWSTEVKFKEE